MRKNTIKPRARLHLAAKILAEMKKHCNLATVFIGYGLKTGQGFHPGPICFKALL